VLIYACVWPGSPFTVYVVTVRKEGSQWQVFRRFKEWEYLKERLQHTCGNAPPFPGKVLFGRMRPEVIETRVLGLNAFLQMVLSSPTYASSEDLVQFLEHDRNMPPAGLDLVLDPHDQPDASAPEGSAEGTRQAQLKRLVDAASQAFIPVSQEPPALDPNYLAERAASYATTLRPTVGPPAGSTVPLKPPPTSGAPPTIEAIEDLMQRLLAAPSTDPEETALARSMAASADAALGAVAVHGKHEVLVAMSPITLVPS